MGLTLTPNCLVDVSLTPWGLHWRQTALLTLAWRHGVDVDASLCSWRWPHVMPVTLTLRDHATIHWIHVKNKFFKNTRYFGHYRYNPFYSTKSPIPFFIISIFKSSPPPILLKLHCLSLRSHLQHHPLILLALPISSQPLTMMEILPDGTFFSGFLWSNFSRKDVSFLFCTMVQNRKKHRIDTHRKIHFPTSKRVSKVSEWASEWAQQSARAKRVVQSK